MWTKQKVKNNFSRHLCYFLGCLVIFYFAYHSYYGDFGLQSYALEEQKISSLRARLSCLTEQRTALARKTSLLRDNSVNKEVLGEYVRKNLNLYRPDEIIILSS